MFWKIKLSFNEIFLLFWRGRVGNSLGYFFLTLVKFLLHLKRLVVQNKSNLLPKIIFTWIFNYIYLKLMKTNIINNEIKNDKLDGMAPKKIT